MVHIVGIVLGEFFTPTWWWYAVIFHCSGIRVNVASSANLWHAPHFNRLLIPVRFYFHRCRQYLIWSLLLIASRRRSCVRLGCTVYARYARVACRAVDAAPSEMARAGDEGMPRVHRATHDWSVIWRLTAGVPVGRFREPWRSETGRQTAGSSAVWASLNRHVLLFKDLAPYYKPGTLSVGGLKWWQILLFFPRHHLLTNIPSAAVVRKAADINDYRSILLWYRKCRVPNQLLSLSSCHSWYSLVIVRILSWSL